MRSITESLGACVGWVLLGVAKYVFVPPAKALLAAAKKLSGYEPLAKPAAPAHVGYFTMSLKPGAAKDNEQWLLELEAGSAGIITCEGIHGLPPGAQRTWLLVEGDKWVCGIGDRDQWRGVFAQLGVSIEWDDKGVATADHIGAKQ